MCAEYRVHLCTDRLGAVAKMRGVTDDHARDAAGDPHAQIAGVAEALEAMAMLRTREKMKAEVTALQAVAEAQKAAADAETARTNAAEEARQAEETQHRAEAAATAAKLAARQAALGLPAEWEPVDDPNSGNMYYVHITTRETTSDKPPSTETDPAAVAPDVGALEAEHKRLVEAVAVVTSASTAAARRAEEAIPIATKAAADAGNARIYNVCKS